MALEAAKPLQPAVIGACSARFLRETSILFAGERVSTHLLVADLERLGRATEAERGVVLWLQGSCNNNLNLILAQILR